MKNANKILVQKLEERIPLGRHMYRWEHNIKMDIKKNRIWGCGLKLAKNGVKLQALENTVTKIWAA
jgi:hypothetical protein